MKVLYMFKLRNLQSIKSYIMERSNADVKNVVKPVKCIAFISCPAPKVNSGEKAYKCEEYRKAFYVRSYLTQHKRIHSICRTIQMWIMKQCLCWHSSFTPHQRIHSGEKPYKRKSGKSFFNQHSTVHQRLLWETLQI